MNLRPERTALLSRIDCRILFGSGKDPLRLAKKRTSPALKPCRRSWDCVLQSSFGGCLEIFDAPKYSTLSYIACANDRVQANMRMVNRLSDRPVIASQSDCAGRRIRHLSGKTFVPHCGSYLIARAASQHAHIWRWRDWLDVSNGYGRYVRIEVDIHIGVAKAV